MANIKQRSVRAARWYNNHTQQVQTRLNSVLPAFRDKIDNSLKVDSVEIIIYKRAKIGIPCSCSGYAPEPTFTDNGAVDAEEYGAYGAGYDSIDIVDAGTGNFGGKSNTVGTDVKQRAPTKVIELGDLADQGAGSLLGNYADEIGINAMGQNANCGVCFMNGIVPSYQAVGYTTYILTHYQIQELEGYTINRGEHPYQIERILNQGHVTYQVAVPKYYSELQYSIRNNTEILDQHLFYKGARLTKAMLEKFRGKIVELEVRAPSFTHVVMNFNLGANPILANMSDEQNSINYNQELTVGNLTLVFSQKVGMVSNQDVIFIPSKNYIVKLTDAPRKRTAQNGMWEWSVSTRTVQRIEPLYNIHRGYMLR